MVCTNAMARPVHRRSPASEGAREVVISMAGRRRRRQVQSGNNPQLVRHWWPGLNHFELRAATLLIRPSG
jgi:hypothetical protein